jgi:hypothetical protein
MRTVTFDEKTHAIVPIEPSIEMMDGAFDNINGSSAHSEFGVTEHIWDFMLKAAPPYQSVEAINMVWIPVTSAGQVKKGAKLRFTIGDKTYHEKAKLILCPDTSKEEVIYNIKQNYYFITSMVLSGFSNHKCVEVLAAPKGEE